LISIRRGITECDRAADHAAPTRSRQNVWAASVGR
jgi:hypothetical protein